MNDDDNDDDYEDDGGNIDSDDCLIDVIRQRTSYMDMNNNKLTIRMMKI